MSLKKKRNAHRKRAPGSLNFDQPEEPPGAHDTTEEAPLPTLSQPMSSPTYFPYGSQPSVAPVIEDGYRDEINEEWKQVHEDNVNQGLSRLDRNR